MRIELTDDQRRTLETQPDQAIRLVDPETQLPLVLLRAERYERLCGNGHDEGQQSQIRTEMSPEVQVARAAFFRDLPALLKQKKRRGQWVVYRGDRRLWFGRTETELYRKCFGRGMKDETFFVGMIVPQSPEPETVDPHLWEFTDEPEYPA